MSVPDLALPDVPLFSCAGLYPQEMPRLQHACAETLNPTLPECAKQR